MISEALQHPKKETIIVDGQRERIETELSKNLVASMGIIRWFSSILSSEGNVT